MDYEIKLSSGELQVISAALGELPLKLSASVFNKIHQSIAEQDSSRAVSLSDLGITEDLN